MVKGIETNEIDSVFYDALNRGVHRHTAAPLGSPAFVWHLVLWRHPQPRNFLQQEQILQNYEIIKTGILSIVSRAIDVAKHTGGINSNGFIKFTGDRYEISVEDLEEPENRSRINFLWHGVHAAVEFEVHSEYTSITTRIDLELDAANCATCTPKDYCRRDHIEDFFKQFCNGIRDGFKKPKGIYNYFYFIIWKSFANEILGPYNQIDKIGRIFVDIRGFITTSNEGIIYQDLDGHDNRAQILPKMFRTKRYIRNIPHRYAKPDIYDKTDPTNETNPQANWARQWLSKAWPLIKSAGADSGIEYTACTVNRGRSLFISSMGGKPPETKTYKAMQPWNLSKHTPIIFYVHTFSDDSFQNGRLIDRILQAGTMRLSSLVDIGNLRRASGKIQEIDRNIFQCRSALDELIRFKSKIDNAEYMHDFCDDYDSDWLKIIPDQEIINWDKSKNPNLYLKYLANFARNSYSESQRLFTDVSKICEYGAIDQRLERSNQYISRFWSISDDLYIERIEGFQPYDEYVRRRLGRAFGFLGTFRGQFQSIRRELDALYRYYSAESLQTITKDIDRQDIGIEEIQRVGEDALFLAILPHYIGSVLNELIGKTPIVGKDPAIFFAMAVLISYGIYFQKSLRAHLNSNKNIKSPGFGFMDFIDIDTAVKFLREKKSGKFYFVYWMIWSAIISIFVIALIEAVT